MTYKAVGTKLAANLLGELMETITKTCLDSQCLSHGSISISDCMVLTVT